MPIDAKAGPCRQHYVDNLRNLAVLGLILFHTARLFDGEPWHMKDAATYGAADVLIRFMNIWHMPILFLLAGMSSIYALQGRGGWRFAGERFVRIFVPLVVGIFLVVLPQVYIERVSPMVPGRMSPIDFNGSLLDFAPHFLGCCYPEANFSYHHLWFLAYLFIFSVALAPLLAWGLRSGHLARMGGWLGQGARPLLLALPLIMVELALRQSFPSTHALVDDWANNAHFAALILFGALVAAGAPLGLAVERMRRPVLAAAVVLTALWLLQPDLLMALAWAGAPANRAARTFIEWLWLLAFLGYGRVLLQRRVPYVTGFSRHALPFYIFHQAVIVWLGWLAFSWVDMPLAKYLAIAAAATVLSYGLARAFDLNAATRWMVGLKTPRREKAMQRSTAVGIA